MNADVSSNALKSVILGVYIRYRHSSQVGQKSVATQAGTVLCQEHYLPQIWHAPRIHLYIESNAFEKTKVLPRLPLPS